MMTPCMTEQAATTATMTDDDGGDTDRDYDGDHDGDLNVDEDVNDSDAVLTFDYLGLKSHNNQLCRENKTSFRVNKNQHIPRRLADKRREKYENWLRESKIENREDISWTQVE